MTIENAMAAPCAVQVTEDAGHFVALAAGEAVEAIGEALKARGRAAIAVPGGTTPGPVFDQICQADLHWSKVSITLLDERMVGLDSPDSNERLVRERLLADRAAGAAFLPLEAQALAALPPPFDLVLLGMGEDGHIASLFPGSSALREGLESQALCIDVPVGEGRPPPQARRTLTLSTINAARRRILMVRGEAKVATYRAALKSGDPYLYPVCGVLGAPENLSVLICVA
jgi:6-phosphogluconolactonase